MKVVSWIAKTVAVLFAIVFVAVLVATVLMVNLEQQAFDAATYKMALTEQKIYQRLPTLAAEQVVTNLSADPCYENPVSCLPLDTSNTLDACLEQGLGQDAYIQLQGGSRLPTDSEKVTIARCYTANGLPLPEKKQTPAYLKYLTVKDWEILISALLPSPELKQFMETSIDDVFSYLDGTSSKATISLTPLKRQMDARGVVAVQQVLKAQPACTADQILTYSAALILPSLTEGTDILLCNPPAEVLEIMTPAIQTSIQVEMAAIPDEFPVFFGKQEDIRIAYQMMRMVMRLSPILPVVMLALVTLLAVRSLKSWLRWWGLPFAISGALIMLIALALGPLGRFSLEQVLAAAPGYDVHMAQAITEFFGNVLSGMAGPIGIQALVMSIIGIGMFTLSFFTDKLPGHTA